MINIYTFRSKDLRIPDNASLRSDETFCSERSASDIEPFLDTMTRLAENPMFQRVCIIVHQKLMVGFGSLVVGVSVSNRKPFA